MLLPDVAMSGNNFEGADSRISIPEEGNEDITKGSKLTIDFFHESGSSVSCS